MISGIASEVLEIFVLCSQHSAAQSHSGLQRGHAALSASSVPYQPACNPSPSGDIWLCYFAPHFNKALHLVIELTSIRMGPIPSASCTPSLPAPSIVPNFPGLPGLSTAPDSPSLPNVPALTRTPSLPSVSGTPSLPRAPDSPTVPSTSRLTDLPNCFKRP